MKIFNTLKVLDNEVRWTAKFDFVLAIRIVLKECLKFKA